MTTTLSKPRPPAQHAAAPHSSSSWAATFAYCTVWALMLFVVALWEHSGGLSDTIFHSVGRLSGLIASAALLVQVLMMARIPMVEHALGQDRLTLLHRWLGFSSFTLMLVHIAAVVVDQSTGFGNLTTTTWSMITTWDGMLLAAAGTLALCAVVLTSFQAARRAMRYENWHLIHLYGYLGAALALPHQLWTGSDFTANPVATIFWWGLWIATMAAVVIFRLVLPLVTSLLLDLRVARVDVEGNLVRVTMTGNLRRIRISGGQYFVFRFAGPGVTRGIPLSLSAAPTENTLEVTAAMVGPKSRRLATLRPGTRVFVEGPLGRMHSDVITQPNVLLIGAGTGVMPLYSLLQSLDDARGVTVALRAHDRRTVPYFDRLRQLCDDRGVDMYLFEGPRRVDSFQPASSTMSDRDALKSLTPDISATDVFICGPTPWMKSVEKAARGARIHSERFGI